MSAAPEPADGLLVLTMINRLTGEAESESYEVVSASTDDETLLIRSTTDQNEWFTFRQEQVPAPIPLDDAKLTPEQRTAAALAFEQHRAAHRPPGDVDAYRALLRQMVAADEPCQSPTCHMTNLGHLLYRVDEPYRDLVKAEDPSAVKP